MGRRVLFVGRLRIPVVSCVATNPCTFFLRKGSAPERTASWITTMRFFLPSFGLRKAGQQKEEQFDSAKYYEAEKPRATH